MEEVIHHKTEPLELTGNEDTKQLKIIIRKATEKLKELEKEKKEKVWKGSKEGKLWEQKQKSFEEQIKRQKEQEERAYKERLTKAKRTVALNIFADELLKKKKYQPKKNDTRLQQAMIKLQKQETIEHYANYSQDKIRGY
jgi:hypothetical protein